MASSEKTMADRLLILIGNKKPTPWADSVGLSRGTLHAILKKGANIRSDQLIRICQTSGVSADWLLTGEGPMWKGEVSQDETSQELNKRREDKFVDKFLTELDNRLRNLEKEDPGYRVWFRIECKKRFPELFEEKKRAGAEGDEGLAEQKIA